MTRCIYCERSGPGELLQGDWWCHGCIVEGQYASFVEAQMRVEAVLAERARRLPKPRNGAEKRVS